MVTARRWPTRCRQLALRLAAAGAGLSDSLGDGERAAVAELQESAAAVPASEYSFRYHIVFFAFRLNHCIRHPHTSQPKTRGGDQVKAGGGGRRTVTCLR